MTLVRLSVAQQDITLRDGPIEKNRAVLAALEVGAVVAAQGKLFPVLHDDAVLAVKPRLHLFDLVDLHDGRTMDASELSGVELFFKTADRLAQQIALLIIVDAHVVFF